RLFQSSQGIEGHSSVHEGLDPRNGKAIQQRELPGVARGSTTGKQINPHRERCNSDVDTRHRTPPETAGEVKIHRRADDVAVSGCPKRSQRRIRTCNRVNKICKGNTSLDSRSEWLGKGSDRPS